jgi:chromosome segregation ATPase
MSEELTEPLPNDTLRLILARLDSIDAGLTTLEERVDRPLQETRPIWEHLVARVDVLEAELKRESADTRTALRKVERKLDVLNDSLLEVHANLRDIDNRLDKLEPEPTQS